MTQATARARARFTATAAGLLVVGGAGYAGFAAFTGGTRDTAVGVLALAGGTGFAAFFSPCSFPLLLTFLARQAGEGRRAALLSALRVGVGAVALLAVLGGLIAAGSTALGGIVGFETRAGRVLRGVIGLGLMGLGAYQVGLLRARARPLDAVAAFAARLPSSGREAHPAARDVAYGFGYLLAGFG